VLTAIPCTLMRGGTSKGLYFNGADLPADRDARDRVLLAAMGSPDARCYLASPAVVAASALAGFICGPDEGHSEAVERRVTVHRGERRDDAEAATAPASPVEGRLVVFLRDGIDTDALCPAHLVYADGASRDELARSVLGAIDRTFASRVREGDILVAGSRFGIGSSREQAVTALAAAGVRAVVAESLHPTFRRNAWNNGFLAIERPELVRALRARFSSPAHQAVFTDERITVDRSWLPAVARDLVTAGGLDGFLRDHVTEHDG